MPESMARKWESCFQSSNHSSSELIDTNGIISIGAHLVLYCHDFLGIDMIDRGMFALPETQIFFARLEAGQVVVP